MTADVHNLHPDEHPAVNGFKQAFDEMEPGETLVYFTGHAATGRDIPREKQPNGIVEMAWLYGTAKNKHLFVAQDSWRPAKHPKGLGLGFLTQKRVKPGICEYRITKAQEAS